MFSAEYFCRKKILEKVWKKIKVLNQERRHSASTGNPEEISSSGSHILYRKLNLTDGSIECAMPKANIINMRLLNCLE